MKYKKSTYYAKKFYYIQHWLYYYDPYSRPQGKTFQAFGCRNRAIYVLGHGTLLEEVKNAPPE